MRDNHINPEKVTKPIQLLAAWLVGLILVNGSFLLGAQHILKPDWGAAVLVIAAVVNVPIFIGALFLLQTKFRPEIQEDSFYAKYLEDERQFTKSSREDAVNVAEKKIEQTAEKIIKSLGAEGRGKEEPIANILRDSQLEIIVAKLGGTRVLAELYVSPKTWEAIVHRWSNNQKFIRDIEALLDEDLIEMKSQDYSSCKLTSLGIKIAQIAESKGSLFNQKKREFWLKSHEAPSEIDE